MKKQYLFYIGVSLIFVVAVGVIVYGDIIQDQTYEKMIINNNTSMENTNNPTFIMVPPNTTDNYPPGSMKIIQKKKVETTH
ncbi:hypothetical protein [Methanosphaera sp.]|jgi:hypothetical protein|uniref:hypothetical protein n=1 Tax=Methanosphaera sp. TaxID=2666342 RepID=UPI003D9461D5